MAWDFDFSSWIRGKARKDAASMISIGGTLTGIVRRPTDGMLQLTFTPTTGSPIVFNAGIVPPGMDGMDGAPGTPGANGETPQFRMSGNVLQYRFAAQQPTDWTDLYTFISGGVTRIDYADLMAMSDEEVAGRLACKSKKRQRITTTK